MSANQLHEIYRELARNPARRLPPLAHAKRKARQIRDIYRSSRELVRTSSDLVAHIGISPMRLVIGATLFSYLEQLDPASYFKFALYRKANWQRRSDYIYHEEICLLLERLNAAVSEHDSTDLSDKRKFAARIELAGLPGIPIIASYERGRSLLEPTEADTAGHDLFSKPVDRWCGEGARRWAAVPGGYEAGEGNTLKLEEVSDALRQSSIDGGIVIQRCLSNHSTILPLSGKGLSTCRVVTVKFPDLTPGVALAAYRMPRGDLVADNFAVGGLAAPVDLSTGVLGPARAKAKPFLVFNEHPDSAHAIEGFRLPHWQSSIDLAIAAHHEFSDVPSVGWDIAITERGPVLVEGNPVWCVDLAQITHQKPLADTVVGDCLLAHFRLAKLPPAQRA